MDAIQQRNGESPPRESFRSAGSREVVSMVRSDRVVTKGMRRTGVACFSVVLLTGWASFAGARTYLPDSGPTQEGDPTADDRPSPGPKQNKSGSIVRGNQTEPRGAKIEKDRVNRFIWLTYVRALIRITVR